MNSRILFGATLAVAALFSLGSAVPGSGQPAALSRVTGDSAVGADALRLAIDPLFEDSESGITRALLVLHDGEVVAERYAPGFGADTKLPSWSIAKCVTAVVVGLMVSDGRLSLDAPAPVAAWAQAGDPRGAITLRHLLTMSAGLGHREGLAAPTADTMRMLFTDGAADMASFAEAKPLAHRPGSRFVYSTATSMILSDIATRMLTDSPDPERRRAAMAQFLRERLADPVGLPSLTAEYDARGTMIGGAMMHMTARDYARFGEFLRRRGRAEGRQILSERWIDFMTRPSAANAAYGGHIWLNREDEGDGRLLSPPGPRSLFACIGAYGQQILVSPGQGLTIVRLGVSTDEEQPALRDALGRIVEQF